MKTMGFVFSSVAFALLAFVLAVAGCSGSKGGTSGFTQPDPGGSNGEDGGAAGDDDGGSSHGFGPTGDAGTAGCTNLQCAVAACSSSTQTTLTGKVYDPGGQTPLYNVIVYVPNSPVAPFTAGPTCDQCGVVSSGDPIVSALTDETGTFTLTGVPSGSNIPLVMQVGKWRRQITIPSVPSCKTTTLSDPQVTRLPKNQQEGDMPLMALTTGGCDALECLFSRMGIDLAEFTAGGGTGRMQVYFGSGGATVNGSTDAQDFWSTESNLMKYDMVLMSCECDPEAEEKPQAALQAMHDYANAGGRIFGTHYQYYWFQSGPADFQGTATWTPDEDTGDSANSYSIDTSFPKGLSFSKWLTNVGAISAGGMISLNEVMGDVSTINTGEAQQWIYNASPESAKYMSFNTPIGTPAAQQCGRAVYSDIHVTGSGGGPFPAECPTGPLTAQEQALEFLFFDLSSCIQDPTKPPPPPPVK